MHQLVEMGEMRRMGEMSRSSRFLRQEFVWVKSRIPTLWTNSYFLATVGGAPLKAVKEYIQNQKNV
jgi:putative transposase